MGRLYHILLRKQGIRQNWNRHITSSVPKQEQARSGFFKISAYGAFRRGSCCDFELISSSLYSSPYKEECREAKIHWNRSETPQTLKNTSYTNNRTGKSILLFFPLFWNILHDRHIRTYSRTNFYNNAVTQCNVDGSQRSLGYLCVNATLTVTWILCTSQIEASTSGIWVFGKFLFKFPPGQAGKLFKCPRPRENFQITVFTFQTPLYATSHLFKDN